MKFKTSVLKLPTADSTVLAKFLVNVKSARLIFFAQICLYLCSFGKLKKLALLSESDELDLHPKTAQYKTFFFLK